MDYAITTRTLGSAPPVTYSQPMDRTVDDSALMLRYKDGDLAAFEALYRRHNDALYRYLLRLSQHPETAEDLFQEAWGKIVRARNDYRPTAKFTTFLYRVAHNCFIDHVRRNKRHAAAVDIEPDTRPADTPDHDHAAEIGLARRRLEAALASLPEEQRDVFLLHEEGGLNLDEIAFVTGTKRETAKSRLRYANAKLRKAIALADTA